MHSAAQAMLSPDQLLLVDLHSALKSSDPTIRERAQSLVLWYMRHKEWTGAQRRLVHVVCRDHRRASRKLKLSI